MENTASSLQSWSAEGSSSPGAKSVPTTDTTAADPVHNKSSGRWLPWAKTSDAEALERNMRKHFGGDTRFSWTKLKRITFPQRALFAEHQWPLRDLESNGGQTIARDDPNSSENGCVERKDGRFKYFNQYHEETSDFEDVAVYLSPTRYTPRRLVVQATPRVLRTSRALGDWKRCKMSGNPPTVLTIAEWSTAPFRDTRLPRWINYPLGALRLLLIAVPVQVMLLFPGINTWDDDDVTVSYTDFPGYDWEWPMFAVNKLDMRPGKEGVVPPPRALDHRYRRRTPDKLWIRTDGTWQLADTRGRAPVKYLFISHTWGDEKSETPEYAAALERNLRIARAVAEKEGFDAFWIDQDCFTQAKNGPKKSYDIYTLCDLVRAAGQVAVIPRVDSPTERRVWGRRMWTFMEGLLAPGEVILFCHDDATVDRLHKVEVAERYWRGDGGDDDGEGGAPVRLLAEHFTGLVTLSRLELLTSAIAAVYAKERRGSRGPADAAYAVMGLLHYRIEQDDGRSFFQSLAQLSLQNDNDQIIERMVCTLAQTTTEVHVPVPGMAQATGPTTSGPSATNAFIALQHADQFGTRVHSIEPLCQVVGAAEEDDVVMLDNCRAIHIRWKDFPRAVVQRQNKGIRHMLAVLLVSAGVWWIYNSVSLAVVYAPFLTDAEGKLTAKAQRVLGFVVLAFLTVGLLLSAAAPFSVRQLFGGIVTKSSPNLVGFEGVVPIDQLEKLIFGSRQDRLTYAPSATPLLEHWRNARERRGVEPDWVRQPGMGGPEIPLSHQLFTLVDIGELSVSIFSAERPPTVALLCGREGGMLRAVLCSWRFRNDCLYKETVVRMPSNVYWAAIPKRWLKVCLKSQDQARAGAVGASVK